METRTRILLVDDDSDLTRRLSRFLERYGYHVAVAVNGRDGLDQIRSFRPHLILLDILMPFINGHAFLRRLREGKNRTPVIMLTTVDAIDDKLLAFSAGADDYINKPIDRRELLARIEAVLRRTQAGQAPVSEITEVISHNLRLKRRAQIAYLDDKPLNLSRKAFQILEYLMLHRDEVITRERFMEVLWDITADIGSRAVDWRIAELRRELGDNPAEPRFIQTVSGQGYRFIGPVEVVS